jgi:transcriptional regulator with XRE-family HTH domain
MRDVPQLKLVREDQGWSQRDLAARSGVAPNTISQLERAERQAMPSTVRKLADALGVQPPVLLAAPHKPYLNEVIEQLSRIQQTISEHPGREESLQILSTTKRYFEKMLTELGDTTPEASRLPEAPEGQESQPSQPVSVGKLEEARVKRQQARVKREQAQWEWYESGRWAEYYVSGEAIQQEKEDLDAAIQHIRDSSDEPVSERQIGSFRLITERRYLSNIVPALLTYPEDLIVARSRLESNDPKETIEAAQLVLRRARKIVEEFNPKLQSFHRIPAHYYEDPAAYSRIQKLREALSEQRSEAAGAVQELRDFYSEALDLLEDQIIEMREEGDALEVFVRQAQK